MKAITLEKTGGVENLMHKEIEKPVPAENEVLVEVKAISINPVDYKIRMIEDVLTMISGEGYPIIIGWDIAGKVVSVGEKVTQFQSGDSVFGMVNFPGRGNAYAEFVAAPESHLAKVPENTSLEEAAATTLAALTAVQVFKGNINKGDRVLIHAGSGGVGHFAIQIAKHLGAYVITTCSSKNRAFVLSLGADEHIDYREQAFEEVAADIDFVFDTIGEDVLSKSISVVKDGGVIITIPGPPAEEIAEAAKKKNVNLSFLLVASNGEDMNTLKEYLEKGILKAHVSKTFAFNEMDKAHEQLESGRTIGKVVVSV